MITRIIKRALTGKTVNYVGVAERSSAPKREAHFVRFATPLLLLCLVLIAPIFAQSERGRILATSEQQYVNMIKNGSFEAFSAGTAVAPDGFVVLGLNSGTGSVARNATAKFQTYAVQLTQTNAIGTYILKYNAAITGFGASLTGTSADLTTTEWQRLMLHSDNGYVASAWVKLPGGASNPSAVTLKTDADQKVYIEIDSDANNDYCYIDGFQVTEGPGTLAFINNTISDIGDQQVFGDLRIQDPNGDHYILFDKDTGNITMSGTLTATATNADTLDTLHAADFLRSNENVSFTGSGKTLSMATGTTLDVNLGANLAINGTWKINGTQVTPTAAEINILSGGLSAAELDPSLVTASEANTDYVNVTGDTMTGQLDMSSNGIANAGPISGATTIAATISVSTPKVDTTSGNLTLDPVAGTVLLGSGDNLSLSGAISGATTITASGDLTIDTDTLKVDSTRNMVGIGTTAPEAKLDVEGTLQVTSAGDTGIAQDLVMTDITSSNIKSYGPLTIQSGGSNDNFNLVLKGSGTGKVLIDDDAEITGTTTFPSGLTVASGNITASSGNVSAASGSGTFGNLQISGNTIAATNDSGVAIYDNASNGIFVKDGGNVGIGTTNPGATFTVGNDAFMVTNAGSVTAGTWNATAIGTTKGGTGLTSIGTLNQVLGVNSGAGGLEYKTINGTANEIDVTHGVNSITIGIVDPLGVAKGGTGATTFSANQLVRMNSGGTALESSGKTIADFQTLDSDLTAIAGLSPLDGNIIVGDGATWVAESGATARTSLGLGSMAVVNTNSVPAITMSGNIAMGNNKVTGIGTPSADTDAVTKIYVDNAIAGLKWKESVRAATDSAKTLNSDFENNDYIDGIQIKTGNRILIKNQGTGSENGIYTVNATGIPTRATDSDADTEILQTAVFIEEGTANADTAWVCNTNAPITIGSTALTFTQFTGAAAYTWGSGLSNSGNTVNVGAGSGITVNADDVALTTPGTLTISTTNTSTGSHTHAITSSSNPVGTASILASASDGGLQLLRLGLGADPDTDNRITIVDGGQIGQTNGPLVTFDDNNNYLEITGGNVGIGTTSPGAKLHTVQSADSQLAVFESTFANSVSDGQSILIKGSNSNTDTAYWANRAPGLEIQNTNGTANTYGIIGFVDAGSNNVAGISGFYQNDANNQGALGFWTRPSGGSITERIRIQSDGNVGIGTTGPSYKLEVVNTGSNAEVLINTTPSNTTASLTLKSGDGTTSSRNTYIQYSSNETSPQLWREGMSGNKNFAIIDSTATLIPFTIEPAAGANLLYLKSGNVGIGTTGPAEKLEVVGRVLASGASAGVTLNPRDGSGSAYQWYNPTGDDLRLNNGSDVLTILNSGNVGIGTTTPNTLLNIGSGTPTTVAYGIQFGSDTSANLYRDNVGEIKMDGDLRVKVVWATDANGLRSAGNVHAGGAYGFIMDTRSRFTSSANGLIELNNNGLTGFTRLNFGGTTSSFPALAVNGSDLQVIRADGTTNANLLITGNVGIGTTSPGTYKLNVNGGDLYVSGNIVAGAKIGGITPTTTDTINISPEFPTAVLKGTGSGIMTASFDATNYRNYYNWTTSGSNQAYDIYVRVLVPEDFGSWDATAGTTYYTNIDATPGNSGVTMVIYDTVNATSYTGSKITTAGWAANTVGSASLTGIYAAGNYMTLKFTMTADSGKNAKLGEVKLKYNKI